MRVDLEKSVLKGVSRSFYLTLRLLPKPMRRGASLGYLLARTSDTLADSAGAPVEARLLWLNRFGAAVAQNGSAPRWPLSILNSTADSRERRLLESCEDLLDWLRVLPPAEAGLIREVVSTIVKGQVLDLDRFGAATGEQPVALEDDAALEDYAWRVAGCVGGFWTKLGFLTIGDSFSNAPIEELLERGRRYGQGLQLVNILRDLRADLGMGRCYLPVANPADVPTLMASHRKWSARAIEWVAEGRLYAETLRSRRLRAATVLPAMIAEKTLAELKGASWDALRKPIKISRAEVYRTVAAAFFSSKRDD